MNERATPSERYLAKLCRDSFLRLWSWLKVYRDQGWGAGSEGKEVCDLLVVFQDYIIIFSDKYCKFPCSGNLERDWCRWFKSAVWKSAQQIWGAERWLKEHPDRLYLDKSCTQPFPIALPDAKSACFHRVVVAHGSGSPSRAVLGGSGSLMVIPEIIGERHFQPSKGPILPFAVGRLSEKKGFIHVIDDFSLDVLLQTLDTIADFIRYLERKEAFVESGKLGTAAGEEELLAYYLQNVDRADRHDFVFTQEFDSVMLAEGFWEKFQTHPDRFVQERENRISYVWDRLIEHFTKHTLAGTTYYQTHASISEQEKALRFLAREDRTHRRMLAKAFLGVLRRGQDIDRFARIVQAAQEGEPYYVFLSLRTRSDIRYEEYRLARRSLLEAYCLVTKFRFPDALDIVGIAAEPMGSKGGSEDLLYFNGRYWNDELAREAKKLSTDLDILVDPKPYHIHEDEYPRQRIKEMRKGRNRNAPCSCGSGKKYKRCCGLIRKRDRSPRTVE